MNEHSGIDGQMSRRVFMGSAAAAAALAMTPSRLFAQEAAKPNSNFNGVQIGAITYSWRDMPGTVENLLNYLVQCGLSSVELMGGPAEQFAGAPTFARPPRPRNTQLTDEDRAKMRAEREKYATDLRAWRLSAPMTKFAELRQKYNDAGVNIYIIKFDDIGGNMSEAEIDYCFNVAKTLGARGITTELSEEKAKLLGPIADKHNIKIGFHNHTQVNAGSWEVPFSYGKLLAMNFDIGHYVAGTNESPIPIIERYAAEDRILSLHIKDRKINNGANMPFGQGDTPLALILQLLKRNKYTFPADIELEYPIPEGSDAVTEVKRCVEFCKQALE